MAYDFSTANAFQRFFRTSAAWKPVSWFYSKTLHRIDGAVYRATKGRRTFAALMTGLPVCMLTTTGTKSGQARTVPLLAIPDGGDLVVIGSNYGQPVAPGWCANLRKNPEGHDRLRGQAARPRRDRGDGGRTRPAVRARRRDLPRLDGLREPRRPADPGLPAHLDLTIRQRRRPLPVASGERCR